MAYSETAGVATPQDLVNAIAVFAGANGWTVVRNDLVSTTRTITLKHASTDYIHVSNTATTLYTVASIDNNVLQPPLSQTRRSSQATADVGVGAYTKIYLFADTTPSRYIHVVIELATAGSARHMALGMVDKLEAFTGGTYVDATAWTTGPTGGDYTNTSNHALFGSDISAVVGSGGVRCDFAADSRTDAWFAYRGNAAVGSLSANSCIRPTPGASTVSPDGPVYMCRSTDNNNFSNRSIGHMIGVYVFRTVAAYWSQIGTVPNLRMISMTKFFFGQEVSIGGDTWKMFPMIRFGVGVTPGFVQSSGDLGYAYKKT